jgi:hypothetical protein
MEIEKIPDRPSQLDLRLHAASMVVGQLYSEIYHICQESETSPILDKMATDLLTAFRCLRRHISLNPQGNRWGHAAAHSICRGII